MKGCDGLCPEEVVQGFPPVRWDAEVFEGFLPFTFGDGYACAEGDDV